MPKADGRGVSVKGALGLIAAGLVLGVGGCVLVDKLGDEDSDASDAIEAQFSGSPKEFLYLDSLRVASYLAQMQGGTVESEKLTRKLTESLDTKLALEKLGEVGSSSSSESFAERVVNPTAESSFFTLLTGLEEDDDGDEEDEDAEVTSIRLKYPSEDVEALNEGEFVKFQTHAVRLPIYVNGYLAVKHVSSVGAIFPRSKRRREAAEAFKAKVGDAPRIVVALRRAERPGEEKFVYLLPMSAQFLAAERSLLKYGGGRFTVVGKIVRQFPPGSGEDGALAYVDSPTLETWEQPLLHAPGELLCRTYLWCSKQVRAKPRPRGEARRRVVDRSRTRILRMLRKWTVVYERGSVILPVAIYK